ncbi:hypothetical protein E2320_022952 [Naja naja]|nr:hypothetical protein E2320_022952 [Naja naja]
MTRCHRGAFENCFYDLCETGGDTGMLCFALQSYADRCAQAGVPITWRNRTFCRKYIPSIGETLASVPENDCLALPCVEGCVCDQGSVLSGEQCVPISQCGCTDADGHYHVIDGQHLRLPMEDCILGVSIVPRSIYVVTDTDFGLVVKFDGNHHLEIQLPGTYFGKPDNRPDLNPSCSGQELEHLSGLCLEIMATKYQACHSRRPETFFQNCLYDMCQYQGMPSVLCDNIQAYVEACKSHGVTGISWRNSTFCPLPCPPNSHFSECASPCPSTCTNLYAPASCRHPVAVGMRL